MARKEKELHLQLHPGWSARDNYATRTKKKKRKTGTLASGGPKGMGLEETFSKRLAFGKYYLEFLSRHACMNGCGFQLHGNILILLCLLKNFVLYFCDL